MEKRKKREVPRPIESLLTVDAYLTQNFVQFVEKFVHLRQLKVHHKVLEISCHGIPWFALNVALIWILHDKSLYQMQVNLLLGLFLDIIVVAVLKAITRRRRPAVNDDPFAIGPDKYSFPSGHASRSFFVLYFFTQLWPISVLCTPPLVAWWFAVCLSRLLMRRHHLLDVVVGTFVGLLEGIVIGYVFLDSQTCISLVSWISDEKIDGAEYDV